MIFIKKIVKQNLSNVWTSFLVTKDFLNSLGLKYEYSINFNNKKCFFTGISLIDATKISNFDSLKINYQILNDKKIAFNLNTKKDYDLLVFGK